jgi:hypothetical protein
MVLDMTGTQRPVRCVYRVLTSRGWVRRTRTFTNEPDYVDWFTTAQGDRLEVVQTIWSA